MTWIHPGWGAPLRWWRDRKAQREIERAEEDAEAEREQDAARADPRLPPRIRVKPERDTGPWVVIYDGNTVDSPGFLGERDYCETKAVGTFPEQTITEQWWRLGKRFEYDRDGRSYVRVWGRRIDDPRPS